MERLHRQYGRVLRIAPNEVTFASADAYNDILLPRPNHQAFLKDPVWWDSQPGHPSSIINAINPDVHARIRKALAPGFTSRSLRNQEPFIQRYVNLLVDRLEEQTEEKATGQWLEFDISPWFNYTTFDIFGDLGFGESFDCLQHSQYHPWIALLFNSVKAASFIVSARFYPWIEYFLMKCIPASLKKVQRDHYQQIVEKVNRRLSWELERPDLMSHVIQQRPGEEGLTTPEISATFMVLTTAGSETTATTLCGAVSYLTASPDKMAKLASEIRTSFHTLEQLTLEAVQNLPYLNAVINEALRLSPAIPWVLPRIVPAGGDTVCETWLPGGVSLNLVFYTMIYTLTNFSQTPVSIQAWTLNRDPNYFHNAAAFKPERWLINAYDDPDSPYYHDKRSAIQPFSTGPRSCMGQLLAWAEMRLILSKLLLKFDLEAVEGKSFQWEELKTFLLVEKRPMFVRIKPRNVDQRD